MRRSAGLAIVAAVVCGAGIALALAVAAGDDDRPARAPGAPAVDPARFTSVVDNPFLPLRPGMRWRYEGRTADGVERTVVRVTRRTRPVMGVTCVVVRDTVRLDGSVVEDTFDWFAQDDDGTVWYFGEDTKEYDHGRVTSDAGSWEAGVDGAQPGIVMLAHPAVGDRYRQEHLAGEAEDMARVVRLDGEAEVGSGSFRDLLVTEEWTPLEPGVAEQKYYARGVGLVLEVTVRGGSDRTGLVAASGVRRP